MTSNTAFPGTHADHTYIPTLDGWRAVAVLLVIGNHAITYLREVQWPGLDIVVRLLGHGGLGVDIFFALSGYLITTLLMREKERSGSIHLKSFYVRRLFRIVPPIAVYLASLIALRSMHLLPMVSDEELIASLFFFRNYIDAGTWYTGHFWTLAVEEHFYLVIPWILLLLIPSRAAKMLAGLALACIVSRWVIHEWHLYEGVDAAFRTENRVDALMWGAFLAVIVRTENVRQWLQRHLSARTVLVVTVVAAALLLLWPDMPYRRTVVALVMPLLIIHTVLHPRAWISQPLEWNVVRWVGHRSYSLYIWHMLFFIDLPHRDLPLVQKLPAALIASLICAAVSYRFVEKPMIRLGHRLANRTMRTQTAKLQPP